MALELRKSKPEEHDEHLVSNVDGSYITYNGCKGKLGRDGDQRNKRQKAGIPGGPRIGWGFVVVRQHKETASEVLWAEE